MKRKLLIILGTCLLAAGPMASGQGSSGDAIQYSGAGFINWSNGWIYATGMSACNPKFPAGAQRAGLILGARKDAQRKLLEIVKGVTINSETVVEDYLSVSDVIRTEVHGMIRGAVMIGRPVMKPDCTAEVTMAMPIYPNLTRALLQAAESDPQIRKKLEPPQKKEIKYNYSPQTSTPKPPKPPPGTPPPPPVKPEPKPKPTPAPEPEPTPQPPPPPKPPVEEFPSNKLDWDGLVIDARKQKARPALLPVVYNQKGQIVYSRNNVNDETTIKAGIAGYARDLGAAKRHYRVAEEPLVVVARGVKGEKKTDPVVSDAASEYIRRTESRSGYLRQGRVMVVF